MHKPETHMDVARARHAELLREARAGELAARMAAGRDADRRALLARLRKRASIVLSPSAEPR
jgi:hypothetical protein